MTFARKPLTVVLAALMAIPLLLGTGCTPAPPADAGFVQVSPAEAQALIKDRSDDPDFVILDVRNPDEFAAGRIAGAVNACFLCDNFDGEIATLDKSKTYLLYCRSDNRSVTAAAQMSLEGFADVYDLAGGIKEWQARGLPVVE